MSQGGVKKKVSKSPKKSQKVRNSASKTDQVVLKPYEIDEEDQMLLRHIIEYPRSTQKELADLLGMSVSGVVKRMKRPVFQKHLKDIRASTMDLIKDAQEIAIRRLRKLAQSRDDKIAMEACKFLLGPMMQKHETETKEVREIVFRTTFSEGGIITAKKEEILAEPPKDTLGLLEGVIDVEPEKEKQ